MPCDPEPLGLPDGGVGVIPLWAWGETGYLIVRERNGRTEFIEFYADAPYDWLVVAHSEQGLLAHLFHEITDASSKGEDDEIRLAAAAAGFRHLDELQDFRRKNWNAADYEARLIEFTRSME